MINLEFTLHLVQYCCCIAVHYKAENEIKKPYQGQTLWYYSKCRAGAVDMCWSHFSVPACVNDVRCLLFPCTCGSVTVTSGPSVQPDVILSTDREGRNSLPAHVRRPLRIPVLLFLSFL